MPRKKSAEDKSSRRRGFSLFKRKKEAKPKEKPSSEAKPPLPEGVPAPAMPVEESKYYAGPVIQKFEKHEFEFPSGYGDNKIILMVRDPYWAYAYWEISQAKLNEIKDQLGKEVCSKSKECLRVYNTDNWQSFDIEVTGGAKNWYIKVPACNASYCVEVGFITPDGRFVAAARSNTVTMPLDRMSDVVDEEWMIPDWEKMYALSGGFGIGKGSEEIRELMKKRFQEEAASGWVSSISSPVKKIGERPFWMWVKADLVLYGATEPTATLTVQGRKVDLRPDGTFSLRYALPDGKQVFPVEAVRDDGAERRKITTEVERKTAE